ncbi:MAG TPA: UDP-N-acetylmuramate dehydrogenase [Candidatus Binatus sp.]|uniref:UDP-N-acetylmuramate dehydrogenase n=1 Tax=Candidatus Binatus sp. TaxID=2811406 RepID=UPI002B485D7F|nr:UDP-N-acetylmuramate dehydrogenase [Candidatus Binatus sp.]HKN14977.1 UDP-N-acetylmuramate dehydrogenase [Candidatus Binatus sp.]
MKALEGELRAKFGARVRASMPLSELTSFRIGGPADLFVNVEDETELMHAKAAAYRAGVPCFCLGAGTNLLVSDRGMRGLVVRLGDGFAKIKIDGTKVVAGAGAAFGTLVLAVIDQGLEGLEFGEGIPGTVGGGLVMNAGAFGGEIAKVVTLVHGVTEAGEALALTKDEVKFAYRRTELPSHFIITRVDFELARGDRERLMARVAELKAKRASRQPRGVPNAGSIFKNPPGNFAGKLLEGAGLKGTRLGGAAFSDQHANFIVNLGGAQAADVRALIDMARDKVKEHSGVWLEPEVRLVGDW